MFMNFSIGDKKVPVEYLAIKSGEGVTGLSPSVSIRRLLDNKYFDFDDNSFKASGHTTRSKTMNELGDGRYQLRFNSNKAILTETYLAIEIQASGSSFDDIKTYIYRFTSDSNILNRLGQTPYASVGSGSGGCRFVYIVRDRDTNAALSGVTVFVTSDENSSNIVAGPELTDSNGQVIFNLSPNTAYYFWRSKSGYTFTNPDREVVSL